MVHSASGEDVSESPRGAFPKPTPTATSPGDNSQACHEPVASQNVMGEAHGRRRRAQCARAWQVIPPLPLLKDLEPNGLDLQ